ncbi:MAG: trypsin-like peptidase domain-containing protein [Actinobacteria bacterium]|nr:trypsin-like peptidase domain-containing protein [Actinomycetota bacterium]
MLIVLILTGTACRTGGDNGSNGGSEGADGGDRPPAAVVTNPCEPTGEESIAKALVRCGDAAVAYVSTPSGGGTGVVIEVDGGRYLLTNAHVVDPYANVDVVLAGTTFDALPVVGIDVVSDVALVGPFDEDVDLQPIPLVAQPEFERGDDAYVVGYPGELYEPEPEDLEPNIARGIMGRTRHDKEFELTYFQSDASIAAGQSGGGLFDHAGNLVGITSMSWADEYTLAVSSENVLASVVAIVAGEGHEYARLASDPEDPKLLTTTDMVLSDEFAVTALYVPPADSERTVELRFSPAELIGLTAASTVGDVFAVSSTGYGLLQEQLNRQLAASSTELTDGMLGDLDDWVPAEARETEIEAGLIRFELPADTEVSIEIAPMNDGEPVDFSLTSSVPFQVSSFGPGRTTVNAGDEADVLVDHLVGAHVIEVELDEGEEVTVNVASPADDVAIVVVEPGASALDAVSYVISDGLTLIDDNFEGPMENDELATITATTAGVYRFVVHTFAGLTTLARVAVSAT